MKYQKEIAAANGNIFEALAQWAMSLECFAFYVTDLGDFSCAAGAKRMLNLKSDIAGTVSTFERLRMFAESASCPIAGYLGYDLKNDLEDIQSKNPDILDMPEAFFFEPEMWIRSKNGKVSVESDREDLLDAAQAVISQRFEVLNRFSVHVVPECRTSREAYLDAVNHLKMHLHRGDIYEANYCIQFSAKTRELDPLDAFLRLQARTEAPFSVFAKLGSHFVISASPERFLKNQGGALLSQPIKGTIKRSPDAKVDLALRERLRHDPKEQSENVMIVDLVRNDLSRVAARGSVKVDALFEMVPFKTVHHMVSSVVAQLSPKYRWMDAIKVCFPMGSMTGAPKISAMKCIEATENFKRGAYSGAFGWIDPKGDFDFNVLIRTLFFNADSGVLAFGVGSAITEKASPEKEYEECLLKAQALMLALDPNNAETPHAKAV